MRGLRTMTRHWPLASAITIAAVSFVLVEVGSRTALALLPGSVWVDLVTRIPVLLFALALLTLGGWWRGAGFFRPVTRAGLRLAWPVGLMLVWLLTLVAWRGDHPWLAHALTEGVTAFWEEAVWRGVVLLILLRRGTRVAVFASAALFAAAHGWALTRGYAAPAAAWEIVWPFAVGMLFGPLRLRARTIWLTIGAHWLMNLLNEVAPKPLTISGIGFGDIFLDHVLFATLFVAHGLALLGWCARVTRVVRVVSAVSLVGLCSAGLLFLGGPRPGWDGPGWDAEVSVEWRKQGAWTHYSYILDSRSDQAEVVSFKLWFLEEAQVKLLRAVAGDERWNGELVGEQLVRKGAVAPKTTYSFQCSLPAEGEAYFAITYRDRYGWLREWKGALTGPGE